MKLTVFVMAAALLFSSLSYAEGDEERASLRTQLSAEYLKRGQYAVAIDEVNKALAINSSYAPAHNVMALIHAELGRCSRQTVFFARGAVVP